MQGLFDVETNIETAQLIIIPVPWDATTSYGSGAASGPEAILAASAQVDLYDCDVKDAYRSGYHMLPISDELIEMNQKTRLLALEAREGDSSHAPAVNEACEKMVKWVYDEARTILKRGQKVGVVGGDHSTPEGAIRALSEFVGGNFSILHIDAHADLRKAYQGFTHSHASIMYNVMHSDWKPKKLVQVGIRDFCQEEMDLIRSRKDIVTLFDSDIKTELFAGTAWSLICRKIAESLSENVYVSFDIDGLSPEFCPHTGTPVPGGLSFDQATFLLSAIAKSGKKILGFDLNEVAPGGNTEWDGNVGARILFKLCGWTVLGDTK